MNHDDDEEEEEEVGTLKYPSGRNETRICIFTARKDFEFKSAPLNFFCQSFWDLIDGCFILFQPREDPFLGSPTEAHGSAVRFGWGSIAVHSVSNTLLGGMVQYSSVVHLGEFQDLNLGRLN